MSMESANLNLPLLAPSQAQKHVTHNEALVRLDVITQLRIEAFDATQPPAVPVEGQCFAVGAGAQAPWQGFEGQVAFFSNGGWQFLVPQTGWRAWSMADAHLRAYAGGAWQVLDTDLNNVDAVGINATADATNRLTVASDASLFNHDGSGHQLKVNKAGAGDTAALLFQQGFSGRAEIGLIGDDDLVFKVSTDGASFRDGLKVRGQDGLVETAALRSGVVSVAADAVVGIPTPGTAGMVALSLVGPVSGAPAHSALFAFDTGAGGQSLVTLAAGTGIENRGDTALDVTIGVAGQSNVAVVAGALQIQNRFAAEADYAFTFLNGL